MNWKRVGHFFNDWSLFVSILAEIKQITPSHIGVNSHYYFDFISHITFFRQVPPSPISVLIRGRCRDHWGTGNHVSALVKRIACMTATERIHADSIWRFRPFDNYIISFVPIYYWPYKAPIPTESTDFFIWRSRKTELCRICLTLVAPPWLDHNQIWRDHFRYPWFWKPVLTTVSNVHTFLKEHSKAEWM